MSPIVSVVVPVYNASKTIDRCVNSILDQTYRNLDIILVDDGSTDDSKTRCDSFSFQDERIRVIHQENGGPSAARNTGIEKAKGDFIVFVDCDDYIPEKYIEDMIEAKTNNGGMSLVVSGMKIISPNNSVPEDTLSVDDGEVSILRKTEFIQLYRKYIYNSPVNKLFDRSEIINNDIRFKVGMHIAEDMLFNTMYFAKVNFDNIVVLNTNCYIYVRDGGTSLDSKYNPDYYENHKEVFEILERTAFDLEVSQSDMELIYERYIGIIERTLKDVNHPDCKLTDRDKKKRNNAILKDELFRRALQSKKGNMSRGRVLAYMSGNMNLVKLFNKWSQFRNE